MDKNKDLNISAMCTLAVGEAGRTGDWRSLRPVIDYSKCIPSVKGKVACMLCWLYCPEGVVTGTIPVRIDLDYCKGVVSVPRKGPQGHRDGEGGSVPCLTSRS
jgi:pyruvate ferredoxin oxidoreductase delta subunit